MGNFDVKKVDLSDIDALVLVDLINDFFHPKGVFYPQNNPYFTGNEVVARARELLERCRREKKTIIALEDCHTDLHPEVIALGHHAMLGTWGSWPIKGLELDESTYKDKGHWEFIIKKQAFSAIFQRVFCRSPRLQVVLDRFQVKKAIVCGGLTSVCVEDAVCDLFHAGVKSVVYRDLVADNDQQLAEASLKKIGIYCRAEVF